MQKLKAKVNLKKKLFGRFSHLQSVSEKLHAKVTRKRNQLKSYVCSNIFSNINKSEK